MTPTDRLLLSDALNLGKFEDAISLLQPLANCGDGEAQRGLGELFLRGKGVLRSVPAAMEWFKKAFHNGDFKAGYELAYMYDPLIDPSETGAQPKDAEAALSFYRR